LKYDYGLYKVLLLSSLVWIPVIFVGIHGVVRSLDGDKRLFAAIAICLLLPLIFLFERFKNRDGIPFVEKKIKYYEEIRGLGKIIRNKLVALVCYHDFECEWALYYARALHTQILEYQGYLKGYKPSIFQSRDYDQVPAYILADFPLPKSIWHNRTFWLMELPSGPSIVAVDSPNGLEWSGGKKFLWIGDQPTRFFISSDRDAVVVLKSEATLMGPSLPRSGYRRLCVKSENAVRNLEVSDRFDVPLQVRRGINQVEVWCKNKPEILEQPGGDRRILLLGLLNYQVDSADAHSSSHAKIGSNESSNR
jgi:hypothetical protein